jgi:hypothetical protein
MRKSHAHVKLAGLKGEFPDGFQNAAYVGFEVL